MRSVTEGLSVRFPPRKIAVVATLPASFLSFSSRSVSDLLIPSGASHHLPFDKKGRHGGMRATSPYHKGRQGGMRATSPFQKGRHGWWCDTFPYHI